MRRSIFGGSVCEDVECIYCCITTMIDHHRGVSGGCPINLERGVLLLFVLLDRRMPPCRGHSDQTCR